MHSKIKSPKNLIEMTSSDYTIKLNKIGSLLICGMSNSWKKHIKKIVIGQEKDFVITGNCHFDENNKLSFMVEKGKATKHKVEKSFKKK